MATDQFGNYVPNMVLGFYPTAGPTSSGSGSPEGVVAAGQNSIYFDSDASQLYVKNSPSGNTGWVLVSGSGSGSGTLTTLNGSGSPEGVKTGSPGWTYFDTTNSILYLKKTGTGNTGWQNMVGV